jgi:antitoxin CptB
MRELDELLIAYLEQRFDGSTSVERAAFARLLELQDPEIFGYLLGRDRPADAALSHVVARIRRDP